MRILKFGGTSVGSAERMLAVVDIVDRCRRDGPVVVVVSAMGGVTNGLLAMGTAAAARDEGYRDQWTSFLERHLTAAAAVASEDDRAALRKEIEDRCRDLSDLLHGVFLLRECTPRIRDSVAAYGERLAAALVAAAFRGRGIPATAVDARRMIVTDDHFGAAQVDSESTAERVCALLASTPGVPVVTGFIAATPVGETTTLGRGGSDLTAAILGAALGAEAIELWTDVDGVLTADPRLVPEAQVLASLSFAELMELSHFGARVVHPPSVHPARRRGIPLLIKNTFRPELPGTLIVDQAPPSSQAIRGISSIDQIALLRLEGDGMVGVPGIAMRLFGALARREISVILITQASSEHSICFAIAPEDASRARQAVDQEFALERRLELIDELVVEDELAVVAVVGESMRERPGIAGRLFGDLGRQGINVRAIAQGSSELNISLVVPARDAPRAVRVIHRAFFDPRRGQAVVVLAGVGTVGAELVRQIGVHRAARPSDEQPRLIGLLRERHGLLGPEGIEPADESWRERLDRSSPVELAELLAAFDATAGGPRVFVDCTASDQLGGWYPSLLAAGVAVVAANKRPFSGPLELYKEIVGRAASDGVPLRFEATVGAGLPVLSTLQTLRATGDRIRRIDGILSGTLNAVTERLAAGDAVSAAVRTAHAAGLTEPHPWSDLSGADVARKICILARQAGTEMRLEEVQVEPLLPGLGWADLSLEAFWERLPESDDGLAAQQRGAAAAGRRLRFLAKYEDGRARVGLQAVEACHAAFSLAGPDNQIAFGTNRYCDRPLIVQGPGAGPVVTAAGVWGDVLAAIEGMNR